MNDYIKVADDDEGMVNLDAAGVNVSSRPMIADYMSASNGSLSGRRIMK